jgi:hypothetical protein
VRQDKEFVRPFIHRLPVKSCACRFGKAGAYAFGGALPYTISLVFHPAAKRVRSGGGIPACLGKNDRGAWQIINYVVGDLVELQSVNLTFPLAEPLRMSIEQVFEGITFTDNE